MDSHAHDEASDEPKSPMWLPALGGALFLIWGIWWATRPNPPPPPEPAVTAQPVASAQASASAPTPSVSARPLPNVPLPVRPNIPPARPPRRR